MVQGRLFNHMKKIHFFVTTIVGILGISLIGCNAKLPTTQYEKVKFAFNGVEKSFKSKKASKAAILLPKAKLGGSNTSHGLDTIYSYYKDEDIRDNFLDEVSYNQPPMVQFQYLKKVLEKVGSGYEFGNKYYDTINGEMYLDVETGFKREGEQYKYNYTFTLGMDINIDDNDLITADISFDIKLNKGNEEYNTKWYVAIELDYDMANNSPNYQMTMVTENDERELPFYGRYTYEYDYVDVKNNSISEWRKFCMDNDHRLVKDSTHTNFNSYVEEGCEYKVDACSWYKNGVFHKNKRTRVQGDDAKAIGEALFADLGLNANEIDADKFFNKQGNQNSVIKTCYQEFNKIAKEDIIYDLVCKEEGDHGEIEKQPAGIRAMNGDLSGGAGNYQVPGTTTISQLLSGFIDSFGEKLVVHLYYIDSDGGLLSEITDLRALRYYVKPQQGEYSTEAHLDDTLYDVIQRGSFQDRDLTILFVDGDNLGGAMNFYYAGDFQNNNYTAPTFPEVLKNLGVPEYEGERYTILDNSVLDKSPYKLEIGNTDGNEEANYRTKLLKNGYEVTEIFGYREYKKQVNSKIVVISINNAQIDNGYLTITISVEDAPNVLVVNSIALVGSFNDWQVDTNCAEFTKVSETIWRLNELHLSPGEKFKIVVNHTWEIHGGYGYNDIVRIDEYSKLLTSEGAEGNIKANVACVLSLVAEVNGENVLFLLEDAQQEG